MWFGCIMLLSHRSFLHYNLFAVHCTAGVMNVANGIFLCASNINNWQKSEIKFYPIFYAMFRIGYVNHKWATAFGWKAYRIWHRHELTNSLVTHKILWWFDFIAHFERFAINWRKTADRDLSALRRIQSTDRIASDFYDVLISSDKISKYQPQICDSCFRLRFTCFPHRYDLTELFMPCRLNDCQKSTQRHTLFICADIESLLIMLIYCSQKKKSTSKALHKRTIPNIVSFIHILNISIESSPWKYFHFKIWHKLQIHDKNSQKLSFNDLTQT